MKASKLFLALAYPLCMHVKTAGFHSIRLYPVQIMRSAKCRIGFPRSCVNYKQHHNQQTILVSYEDKVVKSVVLAWVRNWVINQGLCPWAASVMSESKLDITVIRQSYVNEHIADIHDSILQAASNVVDPTTLTETALIALPAITDFGHFLELVADLEEILEHRQLDSKIQLATFHPNYQFEGTKSTDVTNYTNRSPCALLHLLSVPQVTAVIDRVNGDTDFVWRNNVKRLNKLGLEKVKYMQSEITNGALREYVPAGAKFMALYPSVSSYQLLVLFRKLIMEVRSTELPRCHSESGNLFLVLGINETCTNDEVKAAYFKLAKQWHPDVNSDSIATARFRTISHAYETLKTDKSRSEYIVKLYQQSSGTNQSSSWSYNDSAATNHEHNYENKWNATRNHTEERFRYRQQRYGPMFKYVLVPGILVLSTLYIANKYSKQGPPPKVQTVEAWYNARTKRWETPAPWNADYKKSIEQQPTQQVEKSRVHNSSR